MRISSVDNGVLYNRGHNTFSRKHSQTPTFQADYSDKPVPPVGKAVAAASFLALILSMVGVSKCDNGVNDDMPEQVFEIIPDTMKHSNYQPVEEVPKKVAIIRVSDPDTVRLDTLSVSSDMPEYSIVVSGDSILNTDTVLIASKHRVNHLVSVHQSE